MLLLLLLLCVIGRGDYDLTHACGTHAKTLPVGRLKDHSYIQKAFE